MNPQRPNYLNNDYVKGCKILRDTYSSLFGHFASVACLERNKKQKLVELKEKTSGESKTKEKREDDKSRKWTSWALALYNTAMDPEKHKDGLLEISDNLIVLNDLYPKVCHRNLYFHLVYYCIICKYEVSKLSQFRNPYLYVLFTCKRQQL